MDITRKRIRSVGEVPVNGKNMDDDGADSSGLDIISNLPNELLCHILSFLPTKYAVGTCILSTRWKNLFPLIPKLRLHLDDTLLLHPESASSTTLTNFINFVNRLLNVTLRDVPSILVLRLICRQFNDGQEIANWIRAALRLNIKRITLRTRQLMNSSFLFDSLFGCNIISLNLFLDFTDDPPEYRFSLPSLTMLSVQYMKSNAVNAILASCPLLEYLVVYNCICSRGERLRICIPSLKAFKLVSSIYSLEGEIEIDCPNLEYLSYGGFLVSHYSIQKLKFLRGAHLDLDQAAVLYPFLPDEPAYELIKACSDAERLWFSVTFIRILHRWPRPLPRLPKLAILIMHYMDSHGWEILPSFLKCSPNLRILFIKEGFDSAHYECFKASLKEPFSVCLSQCNETGSYFEIQRKVEN